MRGRGAGVVFAAHGRCRAAGAAAGAGAGAVRDDGARDSAAPPHAGGDHQVTKAVPIAVQTCVRTIRPFLIMVYSRGVTTFAVDPGPLARRLRPHLPASRRHRRRRRPVAGARRHLGRRSGHPAQRSRTGWDGFAPSMRSTPELPRLRAFAAAIRDQGYERVLLMGMGGSSLAPEVLRAGGRHRAGVSTLRDARHGEPRRGARGLQPIRHARCTSSPASRARRLSRRRSPPRRRRIAAPGAGWGAHAVAITDPDTALHRAGRSRRVPRRLRQPARHRRALLRPVALRHGAGGADGRRPRRPWWRRREPWQPSAAAQPPRTTPAWRSAP